MEAASPPLSGRKAEASANDERVLVSARAVLTADPDATMATIARQAGVGVGSLYRRFPSKGDLARRLCLDGMAAIVAAGNGALKDEALEPWDMLTRFVHEVLDAGAGSLRGLAGTFEADDEVMAATDSMIAVMDSVVSRAHEAGVLRDDVATLDLGLLFEMVRSINLTGDHERDQALRHRYLALVLPGLRAEAKGPLPAPPPTFEEVADSWR